MSGQQPQCIELDLARLSAIVEEARACGMPVDMVSDMEAVFTSIAFVHAQVDKKGITIHRLRRMLFGARTEKTRHVCGPASDQSQASSSLDPAPSETTDQTSTDEPASGPSGSSGSNAGPKKKPKRKGHGRKGAASYHGAERIAVVHPSLRPGDPCPACHQGKLYRTNRPAVLVRIRGQAPISAAVHELEQLRCNPCGQVFTAPAPEGVGEEKYDVTTAVMIAVLKYGFGLPFYRLARLEEALGIPLPPSTQWDIINARTAGPEAAYREMIRQAAQGTVVHNDDTYATLLGPVRRPGAATIPSESASESERTGTFTSAVVTLKDGVHIAMFFTGHQHAGENLADVLRHRATGLAPPIHMCDALSRNLPKEFETILCNCLSHARRSFVDVEPKFPDECRHVLETLRDVYHNDELARQRGLSPPDRLAWHRQHSAPLMDELKKWFKTQFEEKKVEPNSTLGDAIQYMQKHWHELTQFLRVAGAPLDNNLCERVLKRAILHRKNSMFFRTAHGAHVGDIFMSLIHTCALCAANPVDYLRALMEHAPEVAAQPAEWMPWNYQQALAPVPAAAA